MEPKEHTYKPAFANQMQRRSEAHNSAEDMFDYIWASPTPYHCVKETARRLEEAGFTKSGVADASKVERGYSTKGGSLMAWHNVKSERVRVVTAHTDSPNLRIKPNPDITSANTKLVGVETYGGLLQNSWLDRDLGVAGHLIVETANGEIEEKLVRIDEPLLRVAQLAIHLDGDIRTKGLKLNPQTHLRPIWASAAYEKSFVDHIAIAHDVDPKSVLAHRLMTYDLNKPAFWGAEREYISSARIDNQLSCWAAIDALINSQPSGCAVVALFDHEEVGSVSSTGADSTMITDLFTSLEVDTGDGVIISADCAHATHPNYSDRHDGNHNIDLNTGPVIKVNANERYATTAKGSAIFIKACQQADVDYQTFVNRTDLRCGSTVGPTTAARTGLETVDVGAAQMSMHSASEMTGSLDPYLLASSLKALFEL